MQCPGQDNRYWGGAEVFDAPCPHCGNEMEFFKDDSQRICSNCGHKTLNPKIDFGCASYCQHAEQCLGSMPPELLAKQENLFKDRLTIVVRKQMIGDELNFTLVSKRAAYGEKISREESGNMPVILTSSLLSKVDDPLDILKKMNAKETLVEEVVNLLNGKNLQSDEDKLSSAIFHDSCLLADIKVNGKSVTLDDFQTKTGEKEGKKLLNSHN